MKCVPLLEFSAELGHMSACVPEGCVCMHVGGVRRRHGSSEKGYLQYYLSGEYDLYL